MNKKRLLIGLSTLVLGTMLSLIGYQQAIGREQPGFPVLTGATNIQRVDAPTSCSAMGAPSGLGYRGVPFVTSTDGGICFGGTTHYLLGWIMNFLVSFFVVLIITKLVRTIRRRKS